MAPWCEQGCLPAVATFWGHLFRRKIYYEQNADSEKRMTCTTSWDLFARGLAPSLILGTLIVSGQVVKDIAGPSAIISVLVAAITAAFSGTCFMELRFRLSRVRSDGFYFLYFTAGELPMFLIGSSSVVYHVILAGIFTRSASQNFDSMLGNRVLNYSAVHMKELPGLHGYPDLMSIIFILIIFITYAVYPQEKPVTFYIISGTTALLFIFVLVVGLFHARLNNWTEGPGFFPTGFQGVILASASLFAMYDGILQAALCSHSAISRQTLMTSWAFTIAVITGFGLGTCAITSVLTRCDLLTTETPLHEAFTLSGITWMKYIISLTAIPLLIACATMEIQNGERIISQLAGDGVIFTVLTKVRWKDQHYPLILLLLGATVLVLAVVVSLTDMIYMAGIASLIQSISFTFVVLVLRFRTPGVYAQSPIRRNYTLSQSNSILIGPAQHSPSGDSAYGSFTEAGSSSAIHTLPADNERNGAFNNYAKLIGQNRQNTAEDDSSDPDIDELVEEYKETVRVKRWRVHQTRQGPHTPTEGTSLRAVWCACALLLALLVMSTTLTHFSQSIRNGEPAAIFFLCMSLVLLFISLLGLLMQPRDNVSVSDIVMTTPYMPWTSLIGLVLLVFLVVRFPLWSWGAYLVYTALGVSIYFIYGVRHSSLSSTQEYLPEERRGLLRTCSTEDRPTDTASSDGIPPEEQDDELLE